MASKFGNDVDFVRARRLKVGRVVKEVIDSPVITIGTIIERDGKLRMKGRTKQGKIITFEVWPHTYIWRFDK